MIAVAIIGAIAVIAMFAYFKFYVKAQASESLQMMKGQVITTASHIKNAASCTKVNGTPDTIKGKYGSLTVSGTYTASAGQTCNSGCAITYTLNSSGVSKELAGKKVVADLLNNMKLSKNEAKTTVLEQYLAQDFVKIPTLASDNCAAIGGGAPITTDGDDSGSETGEPSDGTDPNESGGTEEVESELIIDKDYRGTNFMDDGYYVKKAVNVYDFAVEKLNREPKAGEKITVIVDTDVAVVGYTGPLPINTAEGDANYWGDDGRTAAGALMFDNRWNKVSSLTLKVKGAAVGRGGQPGAAFNASTWYGAPGAPALSNTSSINITVLNSGVIAVGGGGGGTEKGFGVMPGPGAPYGRRLLNAYAFQGDDISTFASLKNPGKGGYYLMYPERGTWGGGIWGGNGGGWGEPGTNGFGGGWGFKPGYVPGTTFLSIPYGGVGYYKVGSFTINNIGSGYTKGY